MFGKGRLAFIRLDSSMVEQLIAAGVRHSIRLQSRDVSSILTPTI